MNTEPVEVRPTAEANVIKKAVNRKALHQVIYRIFNFSKNSFNEAPVVGQRHNDGSRGKLYLLGLSGEILKKVKIFATVVDPI